MSNKFFHKMHLQILKTSQSLGKFLKKGKIKV